MKILETKDYLFVEMDVNKFDTHVVADEYRSKIDGCEVVTVTHLKDKLVLVTLKKAN